MNIQDLGSLGELIAAIATVATLFYLALQIRRSAKATQAATMDSILSDWRTYEREVFILNPQNVELWRRALSNFESLDANEHQVMNFILAQKVHSISNVQQQYANGNISKARLEPWMNYLSSVLRTTGGKYWWNEAAFAFDPIFVAEIDKHIERTKDQPTLIERVPTLAYDEAKV